MKVKSSLKSARSRDSGNLLVKRGKSLYVVNKKEPRNNVRQGKGK